VFKKFIKILKKSINGKTKEKSLDFKTLNNGKIFLSLQILPFTILKNWLFSCNKNYYLNPFKKIIKLENEKKKY